MKEILIYISIYLRVFLFYLFRLFPIKNNKVVVSNFLGNGYGDNPKYIVEQLLKQDQKYDIVWLVKDLSLEFPLGIRKVKINSVHSIYEQVTAKIWIDNRRKPIYVRKRKNQFYIMTWHAGISLKKGEAFSPDALTKRYVKSAKQDSKMANLFLSGSKWETKCYHTGFWYDGKILQVGLPRQDILFTNEIKKREELKKQLGLKKNEKLVLYAPTFRKNSCVDDLSYYTLNWNLILNALSKRFGETWVGAIRLHPNISQFSNRLQLPENIINLSDYPDMQEILLVSDIIISDFSSTLLEFTMTGKPGFIYATDYEDYRKERGYYFELNELPYSFASTNEQLKDNILLFSPQKYQEAINTFFLDRCGIYPGGFASVKVAELIKSLLAE